MLSLPSQFCGFSWFLQAAGGWTPLFLSCGSERIRHHLCYDNHKCPVSRPHPQNAVWPKLSTLYCCARLAWISHLTLHPFDQSVRCTEGEQIMPTLLPFSWPFCCIGGPCTVHLSFLFEKSLFGYQCCSEPWPTFHILQLSSKSRVYLSHGQLQPTSSPRTRCHQDHPQSLALSQTATTALA